MTKWQPIETCPLEVTNADLWGKRIFGKGGIMLPSHWEPQRIPDCIKREVYESGNGILVGRTAWFENDREIDPTHWMALPEPPQFGGKA